MPTVLRFEGYRAFFYSNERQEPPHIHVTRDGCEAKFWLHDLSVAMNLGFAAHEINAILRVLKENRAELSEAWNGYFGN